MFTIVIVEDEKIEREALRIIIGKGFDYGINLVEVSTGAEAIKIIDSMPIDLLLLDINIPPPNGLDVLKHLRTKEGGVKVIVTSAIDDFDTARHMIGLKVDEYLLKPIRPQVLINHIKAFLDVDSERYQQNKILFNQLVFMLDNNLYTEWICLARNHVDWIYSQPKSVAQARVIELANIIKRVAEQNSWSVEYLTKQVDPLKNQKCSLQNYYCIMTAILNMSNWLFDRAPKQVSQNHDPMQKALNYIERHLEKNLSLEEVADNAHVSSSYLSRLFKKTKGINFSAYLKARRIEIAKKMLEYSDMSISSIAIELSYNDPNYFGRVFKETIKLTPLEYRIQKQL